jgi:hypothetical protein
MFELLAADPPEHAQTPCTVMVQGVRIQCVRTSGTVVKPVDQPTTNVSPSALVFTGTTSPSVISPASNALASWSPMDC